MTATAPITTTSLIPALALVALLVPQRKRGMR